MDTSKSSIYGKAYEYACILALIDNISCIRKIEIEENESVAIARQRYNSIEEAIQSEMMLSAKAGIAAKEAPPVGADKAIAPNTRAPPITAPVIAICLP